MYQINDLRQIPLVLPTAAQESEFLAKFTGQRLLAGDVISPEEAARRVAAGTAVLVDVRGG